MSTTTKVWVTKTVYEDEYLMVFMNQQQVIDSIKLTFKGIKDEDIKISDGSIIASFEGELCVIAELLTLRDKPAEL
jgi:hypothetical protein